MSGEGPVYAFAGILLLINIFGWWGLSRRIDRWGK